MVNKIEDNLIREERANRYRYGKGMIMSEKSFKKPLTEKSVKKSESISALNLTGYSALESEMDNSMIARKTKNALRKNVIKTIRGLPEPSKEPEDFDEGIPTQQEGGASKTFRPQSSNASSFGRNFREPQRFVPKTRLNETEIQTSVFTSSYQVQGGSRESKRT